MEQLDYCCDELGLYIHIGRICGLNQNENIVIKLKRIFESWEGFLASHTEQQIVTQLTPDGWSIREVILHLMAWQQISIARLQAVLNDTLPDLPGWLGGADIFFAEEHTTEFNNRIIEFNASEPWSCIYRDWREGFLRFIDLTESIPETKMYDEKCYEWLNGYPPLAVINGSLEHHEEHLEEVSKAKG